MIKTFFREVLRVSKPTTSNLNVAVMMAFVMGLAAVGCGSSNSSNHAHSGEDIDRGTVSESRIDASIARDNEVMPTVKAHDGSGSGLDADKLDGLDSTNFLPGGDLPAGTTLRGRYDIFGNSTGSSEEFGADGISFVYTLHSPPKDRFFIPYGTPLSEYPDECPGRATLPEAKPGYLCVYEENRENIADGYPNFYVLDSFGFGIWAGAANAGHFRSYGTWAVTTPNAA